MFRAPTPISSARRVHTPLPYRADDDISGWQGTERRNCDQTLRRRKTNNVAPVRTKAKLPGSGTRVPLRAKMPVDSRGSEERSVKSMETIGLVLRPKTARLRVVGYNSGKDAPLSSGVMPPKS